MVLEPRRYDAEQSRYCRIYRNRRPWASSKKLFQSDRGRRREGGDFSKWLKSDIIGGFVTTTYRYDNLTIQFHGTVREKHSESMVAVSSHSRNVHAIDS